MVNKNNNVLSFEEIKRIKNKPKKKKKIKKYLFVSVFTFIIIFIMFKLYSFFLIFNINTKVAINETVKEIITVEGIILREEKIITAPERGKFFPLVKANSRVREGQIIGNIENGYGINKKVVPVKIADAGLISYKIDNYEKILNPNSFFSLDLDSNKLKDIQERKIIISEGEEVFSGDPIARLTNNLKPILITIFMDKNNLKLILSQNNKNIKIKLSEEKIIRGEILNIETISDMLILKVNQWDKHLINERKKIFDIILKEYTGIVLPCEAIVKKENERGVVIKEDNNLKWEKITVLGELNNRIIVNGIEENTIIVLNPNIIKNKIFKKE